MNLSSKIESILFFKGEAVSVKQLAIILGVKKEEIEENIVILKEKLGDRGIRLVVNGDRVMLGTAPEVHEIIENMRKEELSKDLGKASLETLSIVLYRGPIRKSEIDYIRGVNSSTMLRSLLVRGLIEKKNDEKNQRSFLYTPTLELLSFLGISSLDELPEFEKVRKEMIDKDEKEEQENDEENTED